MEGEGLMVEGLGLKDEASRLRVGGESPQFRGQASGCRVQG